MSTVPLEFPVLVSPTQQSYHLRPLFLNHPQCSAKRFRDAMDLLSKEVRRLFRHFEMERSTIEELLWFGFNPKIKFEHIRLDFPLGQHLVFGTFIVVRFSLKGHTYVCLPSFNNFFAIISEKTLEYGSFIDQLRLIIREQLQEERKKDQYNFSPNDFYATGHEFVTTLSLSVTTKRAAFPFEQRMDNWFASLTGQQQRFSGAVEITRVGSNWRDSYPNRLQRAALRDEPVKRLSQLIFGPSMTAVVIVGPPGCGRTTLLQETFYHHVQEQEHHATTIWHIDPNRVIAGMSIVGQWQRRFESILEYLIKGNKDRPLPMAARPRLFIDNLVALFRIGKSAQNSLTLSDVLKPYLEQRTFTFIAEASLEEWNVVMETDRRFADLCQVFRLEEPSVAETARIALLERARLEQFHECEIENETIERIFALIHSLLRGTARPGNVVKFMERLAAKYRFGKVGIPEVEEAIGEMSRMSSALLDRQKILRQEDIYLALTSQLIGQPAAIHCLINVIQTIKAGLQDTKKPMATLLFIGPTGVGKTQAAKVLTHYLFTDASQLIRLDMNEFITEADVGRLIGNWSRPDGLLTTQVRHQPFCVLLLDEIEKAHPAIHDLLLQVLGEGRLTDALGRTTDFTNTIIILTSNLGADQNRQVGFLEHDAHNQASTYRAAVEDFFRPELLNRIDRMVVFRPLALQDAITITRLQLNELLQRDGFVRRTTILSISETALLEVAQRGFDAVLGGRALKRAIERDLTTLAASQLVSLTATQPILLDINWAQGHLQPHITALIPKTLTPDTSNQLEQKLNWKNINQLIEFTTHLRERLYALRDNEVNLNQLETATSDDLRLLLTMQESLFEIKDELEEILWAMETARDPKETRFTNQGRRFNFGWAREQINSADLYAHQDIRDYLEEMYIIAPKLIQESNSHWLNLLMKVNFLDFFCRGLEQKQQEELKLTLQSRVRGLGKQELDYLQLHYEKALAHLGMETARLCAQDTQPDCRTLQVKGPRLHTLLSGEEGIHLFHPPNENALPIQVSIEPPENQNSSINTVARKLPIVRSYVLPAKAGKGGVITDLRTGLLNRSGLQAHEWVLLWYANLQQEERIL
jgi:ATP-dependent Clp protease ATP-binding subunit ClpC